MRRQCLGANLPILLGCFIVVIAVDVDHIPKAAGGKGFCFRCRGETAAGFRRRQLEAAVILQHVLVVVDFFLVLADGIAGSVKWRNAPNVAFKSEMLAKELPEGNCLATVNADFQRLSGTKFFE